MTKDINRARSKAYNMKAHTTEKRLASEVLKVRRVRKVQITTNPMRSK